MIIKKIFYMII